jgi:hypothetical protein
MDRGRRTTKGIRYRFDEVYDRCIVGGGFFESDEYYRREKERYWRSLELFCQFNVAVPATILEIGGGQLALLCKKLFGDNSTVADISQDYGSPLQRSGIEVVTFNLLEPEPHKLGREFDVIFLLEVIEHIPLPGYIVIERIKPFLRAHPRSFDS